MANTERIRANSGDGYNTSSHTTSDEQQLVEQVHPNTNHQSATHFKSVSSLGILICALCFDVVLLVLVFLLPALSYDGSEVKGHSPVVTIQCCQCVMWCLYLIFEASLHHQFFLIRMAGYLEFYRQTRTIRRLPFHVVSAGSVLLLLIVTLLDLYCKEPEAVPCTSLHLLHVNFVQIAVTIEMVVVAALKISLIVWTVKFDRKCLPPDIHRDEDFPNCFPNPNADEVVGYRDDLALDDLLERQADLIEYLRSHNTQLATKVLFLDSQLEHYVGQGA